MTRGQGISPKAIGEALSKGVRRRAFQMPASPELRPLIVAEAQKLGLLGHLWKLNDHSVQGIVEGPATVIDAFFDTCVDRLPAGEVPAVIDITDDGGPPLSAFCDDDALSK